MIDHRTEQFYWHFAQHPNLEYREAVNSLISYKTHQHGSLSIGAITSGKTVLTFPCGKKILKKGDLVIIPPHIAHSCNPLDAPRSYGMLYIGRVSFFLNTSTVFSLTNTDLFDEYFHVIDQFKKGDDPLIGVILNRFLMNLSRALPYRDQPIKTHRLVEKSKSILFKQIENPPNLDQLAKECALRPESLIRLFKRYTGMTPKSYLNNLRIEKAKDLLREGNNSTNIAYQLGFSDQSHFQKTFRLYSAITPKNYQQSDYRLLRTD